MEITKRHHFVPLMLLRNFVTENGQLYAFNKNASDRGVFSANPEKLFVEKHLYSEISADGQKDDWLEKQYSAIEDSAARVVEKFLSSTRAGHVPALSEKEKSDWNLFFYYQWKRVPDHHSQIGLISSYEKSLHQAIEEFERLHRPITEEEKANLENPTTQKRMKQSALVKALADPGSEVQDILRTKGIGIARITNPNKSFVIGSQPVVKFTHPGRTHLTDPSVEVWLPISSDIAVSPSPHGGQITVHNLNDGDVRYLNEAICRSSTTIAGRSAALIKSLARIR